MLVEPRSPESHHSGQDMNTAFFVKHFYREESFFHGLVEMKMVAKIYLLVNVAPNLQSVFNGGAM